MSSDKLTPIAASERLQILDVLRGFALLGILICNMTDFSIPWATNDAGWDLFPQPHNKITQWLINTLLIGKFNAIFSFLFGIGFTIFMQRVDAKSQNSVFIYVRRLTVLFFFGVLHFVFIWEGDILHSYAVIGLLLLLIHLSKLSDKAILWLAVGLMIAEISYFYLNIIWERSTGSVDFESLASEQMKIFSKGEYIEMIKERIRHGRHVYIETETGWSAFAVYAQTMLLGYLAGRNKVFQNIDANLILIKRILLIGVLFGLGTGLIYSYGKTIINPSEVTPFRVFMGIFFNLSRISLSIC